jgi:large subunit ribosomal protein L9
MKVILLENIDRLGKCGDVVNVKEGFARNFLIPNKKARQATSGNMKALEILKKKESAELAKQVEAARQTANRISNLSLTISAEAGDEEKLFGSVTADAIADALKEEGITVDKKEILIEEPIKKLGVYQVAVKVHPEVKATLRLWIVKK